MQRSEIEEATANAMQRSEIEEATVDNKRCIAQKTLQTRCSAAKSRNYGGHTDDRGTTVRVYKRHSG
jgi:hypothetical protein